MLVAGGDVGLINGELLYLGTGSGGVSFSDAKDVSYLRRAAHNLCFSLANSNIMRAEILGYKLAWWKVMIYTIDGVVPACLVIWGGLVIFFTLRGSKKKGKQEAEEAAAAEPANEKPNEESAQ